MLTVPEKNQKQHKIFVFTFFVKSDFHERFSLRDAHVT